MEVFCPGSGESAVICVLAYPSESRLREVFTESLDEENQRTAYSDKVRALVHGGSTHFRKDAVNLILCLLYTSALLFAMREDRCVFLRWTG